MYSNEKKALGKDALISTMLRNVIVVLKTTYTCNLDLILTWKLYSITNGRLAFFTATDKYSNYKVYDVHAREDSTNKASI